MNDRIFNEILESCGGNLEEVEKTLEDLQGRLQVEKDYNDFLNDVLQRYDNYLIATEDRTASYGEIAHIQGLSIEELNDLSNELDNCMECE